MKKLVSATAKNKTRKDRLREGFTVDQVVIGIAVFAFLLAIEAWIASVVFTSLDVNSFKQTMLTADTSIKNLRARKSGYGTVLYLPKLRTLEVLPKEYYIENSGTFTYNSPWGTLAIVGTGATYTNTIATVPDRAYLSLVEEGVYPNPTSVTINGTAIDLDDPDGSATCTTDSNTIVFTVS